MLNHYQQHVYMIGSLMYDTCSRGSHVTIAMDTLN